MRVKTICKRVLKEAHFARVEFGASGVPVSLTTVLVLSDPKDFDHFKPGAVYNVDFFEDAVAAASTEAPPADVSVPAFAAELELAELVLAPEPPPPPPPAPPPAPVEPASMQGCGRELADGACQLELGHDGECLP